MESCDKPFLINQEVLDSLEARGHAVKLVDNFGSVVVGIGQYFRDCPSHHNPFSERSNDGKLHANVDFRKAGAVAGY